MSRRRLVAAQAALVAVLIGVIYVTLLQPTDPTMPPGIDVPASQEHGDGRPATQASGAQPGPGQSLPTAADRARGPATLAEGDARPPIPVAIAATVGHPVPGGPPGAGGPGAHESPSVDQYEDAVGAVLKRLRGAPDG